MGLPSLEKHPPGRLIEARSNGRNPPFIKYLRERIQTLEQPAGRHRLALGAPELEVALPEGGLPVPGLHEIEAQGGGAGLGFCAALLVRLLKDDPRAVLWCHSAFPRRSELYGPGLLSFGLLPSRLLLVRPRREVDGLWVLQEGLRSGALAAAVGEVKRLGASDARRLQLAAEAGGCVGFLLRRSSGPPALAALTRWRVSPAPSAPALGGVGRLRWRAELLRARAGTPGCWLLEWRHETGDFAVVAPLSDRPARAGEGADRPPRPLERTDEAHGASGAARG